MFDMLTDQELAKLLRYLYDERTTSHYKMLDKDGHPRISVFSDEWAILGARCDELGEMSEAAYAELVRREQEANADA